MKHRLIWSISVLLIASLLLSTNGVRAQSNDITLISQSAVSDFPSGVRFTVEAVSPDEIDDIRVFFKKLGQSSRSSYRAVDFEPGTHITGESQILSGSGGEYIPPGTRIEYSFEIRDKAGRTLRTDDVVFVYLDNRVQWQTISDGLITVYYNETVADGRAQQILEGAQETLKRMAPVLGINPKDPLHIVTYGDYGLMADALPFRSQATSENLITQGTAFSEERVLLVLSQGAGYLGTTSHEFTHLLVADGTGRALARVPAWLNEGLAEYGNIEPGEEYDRYLRRAIENGQLRPLWHQGTFSGSPTDVIIGYGQGKSVVEYMLDTYGEENMAALIQAIRRSFDIDTALMEVYGFDQYGLDSEWRVSMGLEPLPPPEGRVTQQQPTPTEAATVPSDPTPTTAAGSSSTAAPEPTSTPQPRADDTTQATPGCSAPSPHGHTPSDLAVLLLLGGPLAMLSARKLRR